MRSFFVPILAGATFLDRLGACIGAALGLVVTSIVTTIALGPDPLAVLLVAPMGASAVLIFAVPASPLAQPWSVVGGNMVSALVGVAVAHLVQPPELAAGLAVGSAMLAMSLFRCLHPPGGAAALMAVIGGPAVEAAGWMFPIVPVGLNAAILAMAGVLFHRLTRHSYPHRALPAPVAEDSAPHPEDLDAALADLGETFDISRDDLEQLVERVRHHAAQRRNANGKPAPPVAARAGGR
jgi:CBS domain-containing membrane protein